MLPPKADVRVESIDPPDGFAGDFTTTEIAKSEMARAVLHGRSHVTHEDIRAVAPPVLRHRIKTNFNADAEGVSADVIIRRLMEFVPEISADDGAGGKLPQVFKGA